jgi:menaquinone-dependent protoporphyrinogen oxidase
MKVVVLYGTTEGQTRKIAQFITSRLRSHGDAVTLLDATEATGAGDLADCDAAILAASLHAGRYQAPVIHFARTHKVRLSRLPSAFISVSLSAAGDDPEDWKGIAACADEFKAATGWSSAEVYHVAGAFRFTEYDFFKRWAMKLIAWKKNVKVSPGKDLELTDWNALGETVDAFRARAAGAQARAGRRPS